MRLFGIDRRSSLPPGPRTPALVQTLQMAYQMDAFLSRLHQRFGDIFTIRTSIWGAIIVVAAPDDIRSVLTGDVDTYRFGEHARELGMNAIVGSTSFLFKDGDEHREQRREVAPPFHVREVGRNVDRIVDIAREEVRRWPVGEPFALLPRTRGIAIDVTLSILIGVRGERAAVLRDLLPLVAGAPRVAMLWRPARRLPAWRRYARLHERVCTLLREEIAVRRPAPDLAERSDVLSMVMARNPEWNDDELIDLMLLLLVAGHESSATALAWMFERLVRHPDVLDRLYRAVDSDDTEAAEQLLDATVRETLRIRPITFAASRRVTNPVELGGYAIPAGVIAMAGNGLVQQSPRWFDDPESFRPERFLTDTITNNTWVPFGGGARRCLGASLAMLEMTAVLRVVLEEVEFETTTEQAEKTAARSVVLTPARGARTTIRRRRGGAPTGQQPGAAASPDGGCAR